MDSMEWYRQLLGLTSPWTADCVEMAVYEVRVDEYLKHAEAARLALSQ